jgi:hypothetical protein
MGVAHIPGGGVRVAATGSVTGRPARHKKFAHLWMAEAAVVSRTTGANLRQMSQAAMPAIVLSCSQQPAGANFSITTA